MRLLFAGTPTASVPSLQALLAAPQHEVVAVLTRPPARAGRGRHQTVSPVAELAAQSGLPVFSPPRLGDSQFLGTLSELAPDCCPVVAYGALVPPAALEVPQHGWVNLHFSLLPAWRGAAPVQHALLRGDELTGASTFRLAQGLDTGPVYGVVTEAIRPADTAGELLDRLASSGAQLLLHTLDGIADGTLVAVPQSAEGVSLAGKITTDDARIDWTLPARHIERQVRACTPEPGAWTELSGERIKLGPVMLADEGGGLAPGELHLGKAEVLVGGVGAAVRLGLVQPPGKRPMPAADWARGARPHIGARFA